MIDYVPIVSNTDSSCVSSLGGNSISTLQPRESSCTAGMPKFALIIPFDSQRWLLEQGRDEEAHAVVRYLHSSSWETDATGTPASELAEREFAEMRDMIHAEKLVRSRRISDLWSTPAMLKRTLVACGVQMMGQFTGING